MDGCSGNAQKISLSMGEAITSWFNKVVHAPCYSYLLLPELLAIHFSKFELLSAPKFDGRANVDSIQGNKKDKG